MLPHSAHFTPAPPRVRGLLGTLRRNVTDGGLLRLYLVSFAIVGSLVTVYNYLTFRLSGPPFRLSATVIGFLFVAYLAGTYSSAAAGRAVERFGRYRVLSCGVLVTAVGVLITLSGSLALIVAGLLVLTGGFFAAHAVASSWVGGLVRVAPAQAPPCTRARSISAAASPGPSAACSTATAGGR